MKLLFTVFILLSLSCIVLSNMDLVLLTNTEETGAVCLDGSPGGFYFSQYGKESDENNWVLFLKGGGWCYEENDCLERSKGGLGSSKAWGKSYTGQGPLSSDPSFNPDFATYNRVYIQYCDGASFAGYKEEPITVGDSKLYFRGRVILNEIINLLKDDYNFGNAEKVLLTGCSAGGLATYFATDYLPQILPDSVTQYGSMPGSGFFMDHSNVDNTAVYPDQMRYVFYMQNMTHHVNQECIRSYSEDEQWKCVFAQNTYKFIKTPIMPVNSVYDSWQAQCIFTSIPVAHNSSQNGDCNAISDWKNCISNVNSCNTTQVDMMNIYTSQLINNITSTQNYQRPNNGAFLHSCYSHCAFFGPSWGSITINGKTMQQAVSIWWNNQNQDSPDNYSPCRWIDTQPNKCNPTC